MESSAFVLSICIPTYNRAPYLQQTLDSIVAQDAFCNGNEIEIVIADNTSEDETEAVARRFQQAYPDKIQYHRHAETISPDLNFEFVMQQGRARYLKLHNDNLMVNPGSLTEILKVISATAAEKPVLFFTNGNHARGNQLEVMNNMTEFLARVSYISTWIGGFGMWRDEFLAMTDFARNAHLRLVQTDVVLRLLAMGKRAIVMYDRYFTGLAIPNKGNYKKGGYNIAEVFGQNYLSLLKPYVNAGKIARAQYEFEKRSLLVNHIIPYYFDPKNAYQKTGFYRYMQDYVHDDYFYEAVAEHTCDVPLRPALSEAAAQEAKMEAYQTQLGEQWRALNPHNEINLVRAHGIFDFSKLTAGRRSYGGITLWTFGAPGEKLSIGHFCSIADGAKFLLGGNHAYDGVSTFPFQTKYFAQLEAVSKGPIVIGDDVWVGNNCTFLSGVTVGQGAVIAAGSIIARDIPPYAIAGGNPARVLKYRFEPEVIEKMLKLDYSRVSDQAILANRELLRTPVSSDNVDAVIAALMQ